MIGFSLECELWMLGKGPLTAQVQHSSLLPPSCLVDSKSMSHLIFGLSALRVDYEI